MRQPIFLWRRRHIERRKKRIMINGDSIHQDVSSEEIHRVYMWCIIGDIKSLIGFRHAVYNGNCEFLYRGTEPY